MNIPLYLPEGNSIIFLKRKRLAGSDEPISVIKLNYGCLQHLLRKFRFVDGCTEQNICHGSSAIYTADVIWEIKFLTCIKI